MLSKYTINVVDLIFDNCYIIDRSNDWSLLLFKEAYHIRRCDPSLNHGARASKEPGRCKTRAGKRLLYP